MQNRGVVYTAWGKCIEEAERSASTAKKFGLKTCLVSNHYAGSAFDHFIRTDASLTHHTEKIHAWGLSPFKTTLYLDTDTQIVGDPAYGFEMAERYGMAIAIAPACHLKLHWGYHIDQYWKTPIPDDLVEYNTGVLFHSAAHPVFGDVLKKTALLIQQSFEKTHEEFVRCPLNDQSGLTVYLWERGLNPSVLSQNWNFRPGIYQEKKVSVPGGFGPIKIWHSRMPIPEGFDVNQKGFWDLPTLRA